MSGLDIKRYTVRRPNGKDVVPPIIGVAAGFENGAFAYLAEGSQVLKPYFSETSLRHALGMVLLEECDSR